MSFSFINSSQNRPYLARNAQNRKSPKLLVLARAQPVPEPVLRPSNSVFGRWHLPLGILYNIGDIRFELSKVGKFGTLEFGDPKVKFLDSTFLYKFLHKIGDIWLDTSNIKNSQICSCSACARPCSDLKIQFWEGVNLLDKLFTKSVISGSKCPKSEKMEFRNEGSKNPILEKCALFY